MHCVPEKSCAEVDGSAKSCMIRVMLCSLMVLGPKASMCAVYNTVDTESHMVCRFCYAINSHFREGSTHFFVRLGTKLRSVSGSGSERGISQAATRGSLS